MTFPILAAVQFCSARGDIENNLSGHLAFMQRAAELGASYLLFPELSLTGYEPDLARELALLPDDARLAPLVALAVKLRLTTTLGMPLRGPNDSVLIGALTFTAGGDVIAYAKQYLHPGKTSCSAPATRTAICHLISTVSVCACVQTSPTPSTRNAWRKADPGCTHPVC